MQLSNTQVFCMLDGIDAVGKSTVSEILRRRHDIPIIRGSYRWDGTPYPKHVKEVTDEFLMTTIMQVERFIHRPIVFDRSTVSSAAYQRWNLRDVAWEEMYPVHKSVFITITADPRVTLTREGLEPDVGRVIKRHAEQDQFMRVNDHLRQLGYRTCVIRSQDMHPRRMSYIVEQEIATMQELIEARND